MVRLHHHLLHLAKVQGLEDHQLAFHHDVRVQARELEVCLLPKVDHQVLVYYLNHLCQQEQVQAHKLALVLEPEPP